MISIQNITFGYNRHKVLADFSLEIKQGGIYGLLGKNGTGKSTLLYLMMGLLRPEKGNVCIDGVSAQLRNPEILQDMFLVPEEYDLPHIMLSEYVKSLKPFYPRFDEQLMQDCLEGFDMPTDVNLGALSMGQKKKVYICIALAAGTRYLLMDEPTNGLDILSKSQFRKVVIKGMTDDKTIIISTHQVHDVEHLLDHVIIVDHNHVLMNQPIVEDDEPVNMEELFINVLQGNVPVAPAEVEFVDEVSDVETCVPKRTASLLDVARWDLTFNKPFYLRALLNIVGAICFPVVLAYLMNISGLSFPWKTQGFVSAINSVTMITSTLVFGYMFHNLLTKQSRINELTLPATNLKKFIWHLLMVTVVTELTFFVGIVLADLIHLLLGTVVLHNITWESITAAIYSFDNSDFGFVLSGVDHPLRLMFFVIAIGLTIESSFALVNAWKYRYNIPLTVICHIALSLCGMVMVGFAITLLSEYQELMDTITRWINGNSDFISWLLVVVSLLLLTGIWMLTYRLYCRAQITSRTNP